MYAREYLEFASSQILQFYFSLNVNCNCKYLTLSCIFYFVKITAVKFCKLLKVTKIFVSFSSFLGFE